MNESSKKTGRYVLGGAVALGLFIILAWFAFREGPSSPEHRPVKVEPTKPHAQPGAPAFEPVDGSPSAELTNRPNDSVATNAAVIYRQAFDLFDALSKEQKTIVGDWRTNVDASAEAELCGKIRPICDLMHQASAVTNCDWGIDPIDFDTKFPHLGAARNLARAAVWSAAHCRSNDAAGATDDAVSVLRLGRTVSQTVMLGSLVDMAIQSIAVSYVAPNLGMFHGAEGQRLASALNDPAYGESPARAMEREAEMVDRLAAKLATLPPTDAGNELSRELGSADGESISPDQLANFLAGTKEVADLERGLAKVLRSSSEEEYEAWHTRFDELQEGSNLAAMLLLPAYDRYVDRVQRAEVTRTLVEAGLAVAEGGTEALAAHPDPASGKPFVYTKTDNGFELQSSYQLNDKPMKMQFK